MPADSVLLFTVMCLIIVFLILACMLVWMTKPNKYRYFELPVVFCHRGWHDIKAGIPENSIPAFRKASEAGLAAELDVHDTLDHRLVVCHDSDLTRLCGTGLKVEETSFDELRKLRLLGTDEVIPTFEEALEALDGVPVTVEIKTVGTGCDNDFIKRVDEVLSAYKGDFTVISFNPSALGWFKLNHPEVIRGQLSSGNEKVEGHPFLGFMLENLMFNFVSRPDFISYKFTDSTMGLWMNRLYGTRMVGWTERSMEDVENAAQNGYSTFTCEGFDMTEV